MLILSDKFEQMQALEREIVSENFIAILFVVSLSLIAMLKSLNSEKLIGTVLAVFNTVFVEEETEDKNSFFSTFNIILVVFSSLMIAVVLYQLFKGFLTDFENGFFAFSQLLLLTFSYFLVKWFLEFLIINLFLAKNEIAYFLVSKSRSLYSVSFGFLCLLLITIYGELSTNFLLYGSILLLFIRFVAIIVNNKNLIIRKLFYFILYLCAFEIAPLFILFKLIF